MVQININKKRHKSQNIDKFRDRTKKGIKDDAAWQEYCDTVEGFGVQTYCDYLNEILGVD